MYETEAFFKGLKAGLDKMNGLTRARMVREDGHPLKPTGEDLCSSTPLEFLKEKG